MGYSEFPHSTYIDGDMTEFIQLYKDLMNNYAGTLDKIEKLTKRLDAYEASMEARFRNMLEVDVPVAVQKGVDAAMQEYRVQLSNIEEDIDELEVSYHKLSEQLSDVESDLSSKIYFLKEYVNQQVGLLDQKIDSVDETLRELIDKNVDLLNKHIERNTDTLNERITSVDSASRVRDLAVEERLETYLETELAKMQKEIDTLTPESDKLRLRWLWDNGCNFGGYNALQWFRDTRITAEDFAEADMSCVDWYVRGREVFRWFDRSRYIYSPVSGKLESVQDVVVELCTLLKVGGITAKEYDVKNITAKEYADYNMSAFEYDWHGREILNA